MIERHYNGIIIIAYYILQPKLDYDYVEIRKQ